MCIGLHETLYSGAKLMTRSNRHFQNKQGAREALSPYVTATDCVKVAINYK